MSPKAVNSLCPTDMPMKDREPVKYCTVILLPVTYELTYGRQHATAKALSNYAEKVGYMPIVWAHLWVLFWRSAILHQMKFSIRKGNVHIDRFTF